MPGAPRGVDVSGVRVPTLIYGTAWKEDRTTGLARAALDAGFRGVDTANQRRHYHEAAVGVAVKEVLAQNLVPRGDLFLQTKFTHRSGQDHRLPYEAQAPIEIQVEQSCASSLDHLGVDALDAYLLHGPSSHPGLGKEDWAAWRAMERLHAAGKTRLIGISNVNPHQLRELADGATVKPRIVQNRTLTRPQVDVEVRGICREEGIAYEGFSLLTASPQLLGHSVVLQAAAHSGRDPVAVLFRHFMDQGVHVLTGTSSRAHMETDLGVHDFDLGTEDQAALRALLP